MVPNDRNRENLSTRGKQFIEFKGSWFIHKTLNLEMNNCIVASLEGTFILFVFQKIIQLESKELLTFPY